MYELTAPQERKKCSMDDPNAKSCFIAVAVACDANDKPENIAAIPIPTRMLTMIQIVVVVSVSSSARSPVPMQVIAQLVNKIHLYRAVLAISNPTKRNAGIRLAVSGKIARADWMTDTF